MPASQMTMSNHNELHRLYQLYYVTQHYKIDPVISLDERTDWDDIEALYHLLRGETCTQTIDDTLTFKATVSKAGADDFIKQLETGGVEMAVDGQFLYQVMNLTVPFDETFLRIDKMEVADRAQLQAFRELKNDADRLDLPMRSCKGATWTYSRSSTARTLPDASE